MLAKKPSPSWSALSVFIPISSRKVEHWDIWTKAKVVIGKSSGSGANKTKFNLKSLNIGQFCFLCAQLWQSLWHYRLRQKVI
jgi:hypothetical protein